ncbi:MAG: LysR family transcriptional regulator [Vulcanimicrobiaceae bacterium]
MSAQFARRIPALMGTRWHELSAALNCSLLRVFMRVVEVGNVSAAARSLFLAQSAVSAQLATLNRLVGFPLLQRVHGRYEATAAGAVFYARAGDILRLVERLQRELSDTMGTVAGRIVIASTRTITETVLADIVARFTRAHPDVRLEILTGNRSDAELWLAVGEADAALAALPFGTKAVETIPFDTDTIVAVLPRDHPLAKADTAPFAAIEDEPFVLYEPGSGVRALLEQRLGERFGGLDLRLELSSSDALVACVEEGVGVTFLPERSASRWARLQTVVPLHIHDLDLARSLAVVMLAGHSRSSALTTFLDWMRSCYGSELPPKT